MKNCKLSHRLNCAIYANSKLNRKLVNVSENLQSARRIIAHGRAERIYQNIKKCGK